MRLLRAMAVIGAVLACAGAAQAQPLKIVKTIPGVWIEINPALGGTGIPLGLKADDEAMILTTIGNPVIPAGTVWVGNNGGAGFGDALPDTDLDVPSEPLPSFKAFGMGKSLLPYWDDFGNDTGDVFWAEVGTTLVIEWYKKKFEGKATFTTFQLQVAKGRENIYAQFLYQDIEQPDAQGGLNATIGYQDGPGGGHNDVQWSFHQAFAVQNEDVLSLVDDLCPPDCNGDGILNINDFLCYKQQWDMRTPYGDFNHDGVWNIRDFIAFQQAFVMGCGG